jgi:hypothetical protein
MSTDANKLERDMQNFAALCFDCFFLHVHYIDAQVLEQLKTHALRKRRHHPDSLVLFQIYLVSEFRHLKMVVLRVPDQYI